jgi:NADH-quinone oxidoreductase subunit N
MTTLSIAAAAAHHIAGPYIDWGALSPFVVLTAGGLIVLLLGLLSSPVARERVVPLLTLLTLAGAGAAEVAIFHHHGAGKGGLCVVAASNCSSASLAVDDLALVLDLIIGVSAIAAVILSLRAHAARAAGQGEYHALLLFSVLGMAVLVSAQNLVTLFIGIELLSIPLYVLCAADFRREPSLESGLKYLVIGSVGSATLVYGLALVYGATGSTDFATIGAAVSQGKLSGGILGDPLLLTGLGLVTVGLAFKASVAPFHQWTPDVYEGAPTPITAFMATATKAAALGVFLRFFDVAAIGAQNTWAPLVAAIAAITIVVGNVGALGQSSLKRMLGYSGVGQAGYMLGGVVVGSQLGIQATVLYLAFYLVMNIAAFAVIAAQEDEFGSDDIAVLAGLGRRQPWLAWPMTIAMLALAGIPGTVGFIGKFQLIHALVSGDYTWLAIVLVIGSMISLGYYLRVVAAIWMGAGAETVAVARAYAPIAGGSQEADGAGGAGDAAGPGAGGAGDAGGGWPPPARAVPFPEVVLVALVFSAAAVFFGIVPSPLFHLAANAGHAISGLF